MGALSSQALPDFDQAWPRIGSLSSTMLLASCDNGIQSEMEGCKFVQASEQGGRVTKTLGFLSMVVVVRLSQGTAGM